MLVSPSIVFSVHSAVLDISQVCERRQVQSVRQSDIITRDTTPYLFRYNGLTMTDLQFGLDVNYSGRGNTDFTL